MSSKSRRLQQLNELLERGEISREAYAQYAAADSALSSSAESSPRTREVPLFHHLSLRVGDLARRARSRWQQQ